MSVQVPNTTTASNHGLFIQSAGLVVGAINEWSPNEGRTVTPTFDFGGTVTGTGDVPPAAGEQYENVPGNITGTEITIARYDLFSSKFETAFGTPDLVMLSAQIQPIQLREFFQAPDGSYNEQNIYYGAWFNRRGRRHDAKGDRIVMVNASAMYTRKRRAA